MTIKVYVVDDSAVVRQALKFLLQDDPEIELVGSAPNPLIAEPILRKTPPDVLLLDIEMPGMDGLTFLRQLMAERPIPTVICSTLTANGSEMALEALAAGAVAVVAKPRVGLKQFLEESRHELVQTLKTAARARPRVFVAPRVVRPGAGGAGGATSTGPAAGAQALRPAPRPMRTLSVNKPIVLGSSTGGTQAIEQVLMALPADCPGIAIVQHMPEKFTAMYAQRLNTVCAMTVREAADGDRLERGVVLIAPGGRHMQLRRNAGAYFVAIADGPPVNRHKPSVDVLFRSAAECADANALGIILTGMGDDGARGMKQLHDAGSRTIAQNEESCVVFGMPKEAIKLGGVDEVIGIAQVAAAILRFDARG